MAGLANQIPEVRGFQPLRPSQFNNVTRPRARWWETLAKYIPKRRPRNPIMNSAGWKGKRVEQVLTSIQKAKNFKWKSDIPEWVKQVILYQENMVAEGSYKKVYIYDSLAVAIEEGESKPSRNLLALIRTIEGSKKSTDISAHIIYPLEYYYYPTLGCTFIKMNSCPEGDLYNILTRKNVPDLIDQFKQLVAVLGILHEKGFYLGDIKPQNIVYCKCDCLAFIDVDDIKHFQKDNTIMHFGPATRWWNFISFNPILFRIMCLYQMEDVQWTDWTALALCILKYYQIKKNNKFITTNKRYKWAKKPTVNWTNDKFIKAAYHIVHLTHKYMDAIINGLPPSRSVRQPYWNEIKRSTAIVTGHTLTELDIIKYGDGTSPSSTTAPSVINGIFRIQINNLETKKKNYLIKGLASTKAMKKREKIYERNEKRLAFLATFAGDTINTPPPPCKNKSNTRKKNKKKKFIEDLPLKF